MPETFTANYSLKPNCEFVRQKHRDFWQYKTATVPLLHIKAKKQKPFPLLPLEQNKTRKEFEQDVNWHINYCHNQVLNYEFLFDSMPITGVMFGRDITNMGVLSGEDYAIHPITEFITFEQNADFLFHPTPKFSTELPFVKQALQVYQGIASHIGTLACVNPPTTADAMTTMSMIMGTDEFMRSLRKHPNLVKEKAFALNELFYSFYNFIYRYLQECGYGEAASWFPVFVEGKFDSVRSDISVMVSEKMFVELCLPTLENACSYLDYAMFNMDSVNLIRFLEPLAKTPKLNGIYWNIEPWLCDRVEYLPVLKRIKELNLLLALPCKDVKDAKMLINKLGKSGLLLEFPVFDDKAEAVEVGEKIYEFASHCLY